jgi:hypothetical protein
VILPLAIAKEMLRMSKLRWLMYMILYFLSYT